MTTLSPFDSRIQCEEASLVTEQEFDEVQAMMAAEDWQGYGQWSAELESENFIVRNGKVEHQPQPPSQGRIGGYEL